MSRTRFKYVGAELLRAATGGPTLRFIGDRDGWRCYRCNRDLRPSRSAAARRRWPATLDHVIPVCRGGTDDAANLRLCCRGCNAEKGGAA